MLRHLSQRTAHRRIVHKASINETMKGELTSKAANVENRGELFRSSEEILQLLCFHPQLFLCLQEFHAVGVVLE